MLGAVTELKLHALPVSKGNFSAIHLATKPEAKPYGQAEFAFKGAKDHLRWWFRSPAFESGLMKVTDLDEISGPITAKANGEFTTDIFNVEHANSILSLVRKRLK